MEAPQDFVNRLERMFGGRLRIRWSVKNQEWHIEQKVGRAVPPPIRIDEGRDDLIRARDGYHFVMAIRTGDRMPCPECGIRLEVPVMETADIRCPYCQIKGRQTRVVAGFWPLNDRLLEHLQKIDPNRDAQDELAAEADRRNRLLLKSAEDAMADSVVSAASDDYRRLVGIPMVGRTMKENAWDHA